MGTRALCTFLQTTERIAAYHQYAEIVTDNRLRERVSDIFPLACTCMNDGMEGRESKMEGWGLMKNAWVVNHTFSLIRTLGRLYL